MRVIVAADANENALSLGTRRIRCPEFSPIAFVHDPVRTIYLLSKERQSSVGPIMTALTVAITDAAEEYSQAQPGGRLPVPLLLALDEAANICRWCELSNLYPHFGSRGVIPMTFLRSWAQGDGVWKRAGMENSGPLPPSGSSAPGSAATPS